MQQQQHGTNMHPQGQGSTRVQYVSTARQAYLREPLPAWASKAEQETTSLQCEHRMPEA